MFFAYQGKGSVAVVFAEPIAPEATSTATLNPEAATLFQQGCEAYKTGDFRQAVLYFSQAIQQDDPFAEAYHNRGRATANLRQGTAAIGDLVKASDRYLERDDTVRAAQIKQDLLKLKRSA